MSKLTVIIRHMPELDEQINVDAFDAGVQLIQERLEINPQTARDIARMVVRGPKENCGQSTIGEFMGSNHGEHGEKVKEGYLDDAHEALQEEKQSPGADEEVAAERAVMNAFGRGNIVRGNDKRPLRIIDPKKKV